MGTTVKELLIQIRDYVHNITSDINVDNNSVDANALIGKSGGGDFTTAYASATTITIGAMPFTHTFIADDIVSVQQISTAGAVLNTYTRDDKTMAVAGGTVLTVTGATFGATDSFVIYSNITRTAMKDVANTARTTGTLLNPVQAIDEAGDVIKTSGIKTDTGTIAGDTTSIDGKITACNTGAVVVSTALPTGTNSIGKIGHNITGIGDNRKVVTTAGTRVTLASSTTIKEVTITAETNNTDIVVIGGSTVVASLTTRRGSPLYPGDTITLKADNLADIYVDSLVSTEGVTFSYLT